mmetsp:Transcript_15983/g.24006  ORF Transcript_15983/g.24006 Transcript_15983/m.24006 type:complete len:577 (+) Transcript_15983:21-1751(+)
MIATARLRAGIIRKNYFPCISNNTNDLHATFASIKDGLINANICTNRCFQSRAEYAKWTQQMNQSRMIIHNNKNNNNDSGTRDLVALKQVNARTGAPFLYSVSPISDRLLLYAHDHDDKDKEESKICNNISNDNNPNVGDSSSGKTPFSSMLECIYPLSESRLSEKHQHGNFNRRDLDILRASVADLGAWSSFRLSKFYSDVDALTADVAYRHASSSTGTNDVSFVTAGHYHSRKIHRTDLTKDVILRCYPTHTGQASLEIRTDALQIDDNGNEVLVNVCFTSMVAVDKETLRPKKGFIPPLKYPIAIHGGNQEMEMELERQQIRSEMAQQHARIRKNRVASSMQLRGPSSSPPTQGEMAEIHNIHQRTLLEHDIPHVRQHTYRSSVVVYPERRNVHGKMFGGFVMEHSHTLAQYAADFYLHHNDNCKQNEDECLKDDILQTNDGELTDSKGKLERAIPLGLDEAIFLQPVSIGDHVTFTARVVHSTRNTCRVVVVVEVREPSNRHSPPLRSNRLSFLFGGSGFPNCSSCGGGIVPDSYSEILMHVDAKRRVAVEGPLEDEVERILNEICHGTTSG